jgi:hypothetical protein
VDLIEWVCIFRHMAWTERAVNGEASL